MEKVTEVLYDYTAQGYSQFGRVTVECDTEQYLVRFWDPNAIMSDIVEEFTFDTLAEADMLFREKCLGFKMGESDHSAS